MNLNKFLFILFIAISVLVVSCNPDDGADEDINSGDIRDKISGTWKSQENSTTYGVSNYYVEIIKDTITLTGIKIDNFFNLGINKKLRASVSGSTINLSTTPLEGNVFIGSGNISSNYKSISFTYTFNDGNGAKSVSGTYTKL